MLFNYACVVPTGMVVFVPSYHFLNSAKDLWSKNKTLDRLSQKKAVGREISTNPLRTTMDSWGLGLFRASRCHRCR